MSFGEHGYEMEYIQTALHNNKIDYDNLLEDYVYWDLKEANDDLSDLHKEEEIILINLQLN